MFSSIRSLPGSKKQFPDVKSKIDCKRPTIPSASAAPVKTTVKEVKTISPRSLISGPKPKVPVVSIVKASHQPFRARPVPQSHYGQPFRPVLARTAALPSREAVEDPNNGQSASGLVVVPVQLAAEEVPLPLVAMEAISADQSVEEVPVVPETVEAAPLPAEQVVELLCAVEACQVEEPLSLLPPVTFADEALEVPLQASETEKKKKKRNRKKKSSALAVSPAPEVPVEAESQATDEGNTITKLTRKQRQNIHTNRRRSAAWKALRQTLGPDAHIYIPPRFAAANDLAPKEVVVDALSPMV